MLGMFRDTQGQAPVSLLQAYLQVQVQLPAAHGPEVLSPAVLCLFLSWALPLDGCERGALVEL